MIFSCQKTLFRELYSSLIPGTENEEAHADFLTADTAGQRDDFSSSPRVFSQLEIDGIGRT